MPKVINFIRDLFIVTFLLVIAIEVIFPRLQSMWEVVTHLENFSILMIFLEIFPTLLMVFASLGLLYLVFILLHSEI
jgi:hypothetical protein